MKIHLNGKGMVADTANVDPSAFIENGCQILENAIVGPNCRVTENSIVYGNAILQNGSAVGNGAKIGGSAFLNATNIHGAITLLNTPITIHGFEQEIVVADDFIIIGCQCIDIAQWKTRSLALLRANGFPQKSAERIRDSIDVVHQCYTSVYHEEDLKEAYKVS
jgi:carbonic anhydrase/acetyltransferase-like protein (isoleucine patch superfamily)